MRKFKKPLFIALGVAVSLVILVIAFISPITKYLVEKYDVKYTGRQITMDWAYVNPFTGYVHFSGLKIYEYKSDSLFISMNGLTANFEVFQLFSRNIEILDFTLTKPKIVISQKNLHFNFDDLVTKFSSDSTADTTPSDPIHFSMLDLKIIDGHFYYIDSGIPVNFSIKNVNIESKEGWRWDRDTIAAKFSFLSEIGTGGMKGYYNMNLKNLDYKINVAVSKFDLKVIEQYYKGFANYGTLRGNLEADLKTIGNFNNAENITMKGDLAINEFHFGKNPMEDYLSFDKVIFKMNEVNPQKNYYFIDSMALIHPYFKYEQYDSTDNLETMFGKGGANAALASSDPAEFNLIFTIGRYVEKLAKNFLRSNYKVNKLGIYNCNLLYNDYSQAEKFSVALNPLEIRADSVFKTKARVNLTLNSAIKPYGNAAIRISINPKDTGDFDLYYNFQTIPLAMFNPYLVSLTSFPLDRGTLEFEGLWNVRNGNIQSKNHLLLIDSRLTKRVRKKGLSWLPMRLIMALVREEGNVIDYEIPITGNLNSPKFHWRDVILDIVKNIFIKPITTPYRLEVRSVETKIEKSLTLNWYLTGNKLEYKQQKFVEHMADFLAKNPEASIVVNPQNYSLREKEHLLFYEAKKKYYLMLHNKNIQSFSKADAEIVDKMSVRNPLFVAYLNKQVKDPLVFTIQGKCAILIDPGLINVQFNKLNEERASAFMAYFKARNTEKQIHFSGSKNAIPYNGFSFYMIEYKGELPKSLLSAYLEMNELNDEAPRKEFKKERLKNGKL